MKSQIINRIRERQVVVCKNRAREANESFWKGEELRLDRLCSRLEAEALRKRWYQFWR